MLDESNVSRFSAVYFGFLTVIVYTAVYYVIGEPMARTSDTREKTRAIAEQLYAQGITPSSRKVLELLGNKGSLTTITDELAKIEDERSGASAPAAPPPELPAVPLDVSGLIPLLQALREQMESLLKINEDSGRELVELRQEMVELRKTHAEQLAVAYQRYEAVQRHAMVQIDEARQTAAQLRERVRVVTLESDTRETAHSGKLQALREENARLRGRVETLEELVQANKSA